MILITKVKNYLKKNNISRSVQKNVYIISKVSKGTLGNGDQPRERYLRGLSFRINW